MLELTRLLPNEHNVNSVINADREDEPERKHVEQVQMKIEQLHRRNHRANSKREGDDLD